MAKRTRKRRKILVMEDEGPIADMICDFCEVLGFEAKKYEADVDLMEVVKGFRPDLITLDLVMPKMSGVEVLEFLHHDEETKSIPIIVISSIVGNDSVDEIIKQCQGILQKPIHLKVLKEKINEIFCNVA